jgi:hypothetical protein
MKTGIQNVFNGQTVMPYWLDPTPPHLALAFRQLSFCFSALEKRSAFLLLPLSILSSRATVISE